MCIQVGRRAIERDAPEDRECLHQCECVCVCVGFRLYMNYLPFTFVGFVAQQI